MTSHQRYSVSNYRQLHCWFNRFFKCTSKNTSKLRVTGFCEGIPPISGGFPSQGSSSAVNVSIWWRHHGCQNANFQYRMLVSAQGMYTPSFMLFFSLQGFSGSRGKQTICLPGNAEFRSNKASAVPPDALNPCVNRPSAVTAFTIWYVGYWCFNSMHK